jgi:hypothetical protein
MIEFDGNGKMTEYILSTRRKYSVSLVIPTLNEARNLPLVLPYIPLDWVDEVILVDGCSTDGTVETARQLLPEVKVILEERPGKGAALQAGYAAALGDIIVLLDADGSNDPREIPRFVQALLEGADFVKGSRFAPSGGTTDMPRLRKLGNWGFVVLVNLFFSVRFTDLAYGYHAFWRHTLDSIDFSGIDGFEIDAALYLRALRAGLRLVEAPSFEGHRFYGEGKLQTFPDGWRVLRTILREWLYSLRPKVDDPHKGFRGSIPASSILDAGTASALARREGEATRPARHLVTQTILQLLQSSIQGAPGDPGYETILPFLLLLSMKSMQANSGSIVLLDEENEVVDSYAVYRGKVHPLDNQQVSETVECGLAGWIVANEQPTLVENTLEDPRWLVRPWEENKKLSRSALGIPLREGEQVVGVLTLVREGQSFTGEDLADLKEVLAPEEESFQA